MFGIQIIMEPFPTKDDIQYPNPNFFLDQRIILLAGRINTETVTSSVLKNLRTGADKIFVLRFVKASSSASPRDHSTSFWSS